MGGFLVQELDCVYRVFVGCLLLFQPKNSTQQQCFLKLPVDPCFREPAGEEYLHWPRYRCGFLGSGRFCWARWLCSLFVQCSVVLVSIQKLFGSKSLDTVQFTSLPCVFIPKVSFWGGEKAVFWRGLKRRVNLYKRSNKAHPEAGTQRDMMPLRGKSTEELSKRCTNYLFFKKET